MNGDYNGWMDVPEAEREALDVAWNLIDAGAINRRRRGRAECPDRRRPGPAAPYTAWPTG
jgi:hypothetical protein